MSNNTVSENEVIEQMRLNQIFGLSCTRSEAEEQVRQTRYSIEQFKAKNPVAWEDAEAAAAQVTEARRYEAERDKRRREGG